MKNLNKPASHTSNVSGGTKPKSMKGRQIDFEHFLFYAILTFLAMFAFSICAHSQTTELPPFDPAFFKEWVTVLTAGVVYFVTFISYKIPLLNRLTSTSLRYIVIALVAGVFVWAFGWNSLIGALTSIGLPSFIAVLLKQLFGLKTPAIVDARTAEQKEIDKAKKDAKMHGK